MIELSPAQREKVKSCVRRCRQDFLYLASRFLKIQTLKGNQIANLEFHTPQQLLHRMVDEHIIGKGRRVRVVALKARRMGFSTYWSARFYWRVSFRKNRYAAQITHEPEATDTLFKMIKRFWNHSPEWLRPAQKYNNSRLLEFDTKDGKGLASAFRVATAGKEDYGSGQAIHYLHLCMALDTPILVADGGEKLAKDVTPGDRIITHNGHMSEISAVVRKPSHGPMVAIRPWLGRDIVVSQEHRVWTNMGWVRAGDLDPSWHMVSMPIRPISSDIHSLPVKGRASNFGPRYNGPQEFPLTEETGYAIGYYLAEGHVSQSNMGYAPYGKVIFTLHVDEDRFALRACAALAGFCNKPPSIKVRPGTKTKTYTLNSSSLATFVAENFGRTREKRIPDWVFCAGEPFARGVVAGYLCGDGSKGMGGSHQGCESNSISASSIRESLTYQIRDLVASLGYGWGSVKRTPGGVYHGRKCQDQWTCHFNGACGYALRKLMGIPYAELSDRHRRGERYRLDFNNNKVWLRIRSISEQRVDEVIDFEVAHEDHSFRTAHFAVSNSEVSKWPVETQESLLTSVLQCVPDDEDTEIVFESTAKGVGGQFHSRFWACRYRLWVSRLDAETGHPVITETLNSNAEAENEYTAIFLPWFVFPEYLAPVPATFKLTPDEQAIKERYNLHDGQMFWRRLTIANKCDGSEEKFFQEYPANPEEAFLSTGRPVFDNIKLEALKAAAPKPVATYEYEFDTTGGGSFVERPLGRFRVWEQPRDGETYVVGADVAEGLLHGDYSYATVVNHRTGVQVAEWHGKLDPDLLAKVLAAIGYKYHTALLAPERNNHGLIVVTHLQGELKYPSSRIYVEHIPEPPGKPRPRYGWQTSNATRPLIIDNLVREVREGTHLIRSADVFAEMQFFKVQDNGRQEADPGQHDDRVMGTAIAKHVRLVTRTPVAPPQTRKPSGSMRGKGGKKRWK